TSAIGQKITTVREALGVSVEQLAERSGCESSVVCSIEAGKQVPSLAPLIKIARALGVRLGTLLDDVGGLGPVVTRHAQVSTESRLRRLETGTGPKLGSLEFFSLADGKATRHMEPFLVTVHPGDGGAESSHEGEELLYVLEGNVTVAYGKELHALGPGDSIYYDSIVPHVVRAVGDTTARLLAVVYAPV
ncbi:MAG TPA: cupin domain-containing protein, partial [Polyangiaceae bacterium]